MAQIDRDTYRVIFSGLNAEIAASKAALESIRRIKAQLEIDEAVAIERVAASKRRLTAFEAMHDSDPA